MTVNEAGPPPVDEPGARAAGAPVPDPFPREWDPWRKVDPRSEELSGYAVLAFIFGLLGGLPGLVFGIAALVKIKRTGQRGRGLAIAGLVFTGAWAMVLVLVFAFVVYRNDRTADLRAVQVGQCLSGPRPGAQLDPRSMMPVPCTQPHAAEMIGSVFSFTRTDNPTAYPGPIVLAQWADSGCREVARTYVLDPLSLPPDARVRWYLPTAVEWPGVGQSIPCFLASDGAPLTRSVRLDAAMVSADQLRFLMAVGEFHLLADRVDALRTNGSSASLPAAVEQASDAHARMRYRLRVGPWPDQVQPAVDRLLDGLEAAGPLWENAAQAATHDNLLALLTQAQRRPNHHDESAVRRALGLPTVQGGPVTPR